jgi:hypothetical protein
MSIASSKIPKVLCGLGPETDYVGLTVMTWSFSDKRPIRIQYPETEYCQSMKIMKDSFG